MMYFLIDGLYIVRVCLLICVAYFYTAVFEEQWDGAIRDLSCRHSVIPSFRYALYWVYLVKSTPFKTFKFADILCMK